MARHCNWRDCQAWRNEGLEMSTTSNEAAKFFDASLSQLVGWYEDKSLGGLEKSLQNMLAADSNFVMGQVLDKGLELIGSAHKSPEEDQAVRQEVESLIALANKPETNSREKQHINAVKMLMENRWEDALATWENILLDYPTDMLAIQYSELGYFHIGDQARQRDFKYRVLPQWNPSIPLYSYLYGMIAFGEMETRLYEKAERSARKGLELNPLDGWATHAVAHVLDHTGRYEEGIKFMTSTMQDWSTNDTLVCHNQWHLGLYYIEKGDFDAVLHHYDTEIEKYGKSVFQGTDRASMLLRLEMEGVDVGNRWAKVHDLLRPHLDDHTACFHDVHGMMTCVGVQQKKLAEDMLESMRNFINSGTKQSHYRRVAETVGAPLCEAVLAWGDKDYARATDLLLPLRYRTNEIGGSNAQRDVLSQLLIHSALLSPEKRHQKIARNLVYERKGQKDTPLTERLLAQVLQSQDD